MRTEISSSSATSAAVTTSRRCSISRIATSRSARTSRSSSEVAISWPLHSWMLLLNRTTGSSRPPGRPPMTTTPRHDQDPDTTTTPDTTTAPGSTSSMEPLARLSAAVGVAATTIDAPDPAQYDRPTPCPPMSVGRLPSTWSWPCGAAPAGRDVPPAEWPIDAATSPPAPGGDARAAGSDVEQAWADPALLERLTALPWGRSPAARCSTFTPTRWSSTPGTWRPRPTSTPSGTGGARGVARGHARPTAHPGPRPRSGRRSTRHARGGPARHPVRRQSTSPRTPR